MKEMIEQFGFRQVRGQSTGLYSKVAHPDVTKYLSLQRKSVTKLSEVTMAGPAKVATALQAQHALDTQQRASEKLLGKRASWALGAPLVRTGGSPCPCWVPTAPHPWVAEAAGRSSAALAPVSLLRACSVPSQPSASQSCAAWGSDAAALHPCLSPLPSPGWGESCCWEEVLGSALCLFQLLKTWFGICDVNWGCSV